MRLWQRAWTANQELAGGLGPADCMILPRTLLPSRRTPDLQAAGGHRSFRAPAGGTGTLPPPTRHLHQEDTPLTSSPLSGVTARPLDIEPGRHSNGHRSPAAREPPAVRRPRQAQGNTEADEGLGRIAGVGPVSVLKLRNKGHDSIKSLSDLYTGELQSDQLRLIDYLKVVHTPELRAPGCPCGQLIASHHTQLFSALAADTMYSHVLLASIVAAKSV